MNKTTTDKRLTTKELRKILLDYTGGQLFNKSVKGMENYIRINFNTTEYAVKTLAKEFTR